MLPILPIHKTQPLKKGGKKKVRPRATPAASAGAKKKAVAPPATTAVRPATNDTVDNEQCGKKKDEGVENDEDDGVADSTAERRSEEKVAQSTATTKPKQPTQTKPKAKSTRLVMPTSKARPVKAPVAKPVANPMRPIAAAAGGGGSGVGGDATNVKPATTVNSTVAQPNTKQTATSNNNNSNNNEEALLLAAEAAAALLDDSIQKKQHQQRSNDTLLEDVVHNVNVAAAVLTGERLDSEQERDVVVGMSQEVRASLKRLTTNNNDDDNSNTNQPTHNLDEYQGPLGPTSQVRTFQSKLPPTTQMSASQTNFLSYYYGNESAGSHQLGGHHVGRGLKSGNNVGGGSGGREGYSDDEEEIVEDIQQMSDTAGDVVQDGDTGAQFAAAFGQMESTTNDAVEAHREFEGVEPKAPTLYEMTKLKSFCSKYPKNASAKSKRGRKKKGVADYEEEALLKEEEAIAAEMTVIEQTTTTTTADEAEVNEEVDAGPQVEVVNGQIVVAQSSLLPNPETRTSTELIDKEFGDAVEDETSSQLGAIQARYDSYVTNPRQRPQRWGVNETKSFYRALRQCGTDFQMMQMFMVGRSRAQLKSKFKMESRRNPRLVDMALDPKSRVKLGE